MSEIVYFDGVLKSLEEMDINPLEPGFLYGAGLFETVRVEEGVALFLEEHLERLAAGTRHLGWDPPAASVLTRAVENTIAANRVRYGRLRLCLLLAGRGHRLLVSAQEGIPYTPDDYLLGFTACFSEIRKNQRSALCGLKSMNYLEHFLAWREAQEKGVREALLLNLDGFLSEGSRSNLFLVREGVLLTPGLDDGPLPGLVRRRVLELAQQLGYRVREQHLSPDDLLDAEEAFLTNSLMEILPLTRVEQKIIGSGKPGTVTTSLRLEYQKRKSLYLKERRSS